MLYTLLNDGDKFEQRYWNIFIKDKFPSFEKYWSIRITPLTNRPQNIHFKKSSVLLSLGFTDEDVCKAQLHYTLLRHLVRSYEILFALKTSHQSYDYVDYLSEGLFHITAAQDVAFEFLQRNATPGVFDAWVPKKGLSVNKKIEGSDEARKKWQKDNDYPLQDIRNYRNHLTHGRISPNVLRGIKLFVPRIAKENVYLDWRLVTDGFSTSAQSDFDSLDNILEKAWTETLSYFENEWQNFKL